MTPVDLFEDGQLSAAIQLQRQIVQENKDDLAGRLLLCELVAFTSDFPEVQRLLNDFPTEDPEWQAYISSWRDLLTADHLRHIGQKPDYLMPVPQEIAAIQMAIEQADEDLFERAVESLPAIEGFHDGRPFEECRDSDDLLMGIFEFFFQGKYIAIPWSQIRKIRLDEMENLRDQLYRPTLLTLADGREFDGFAPSKYIITKNEPEEFQCGFDTDYLEHRFGVTGVGAKRFIVGEEELRLDEFTQLELRCSD